MHCPPSGLFLGLLCNRHGTGSKGSWELPPAGPPASHEWGFCPFYLPSAGDEGGCLVTTPSRDLASWGCGEGPGPAGALGLPGASVAGGLSLRVCTRVLTGMVVSGGGLTQPRLVPHGPSFSLSAPSALPAASGTWFWGLHLPHAERAPHLFLSAWCPSGRWAGGSRRRGGEPASRWACRGLGQGDGSTQSLSGEGPGALSSLVSWGVVSLFPCRTRVWTPTLTCTCADVQSRDGRLPGRSGEGGEPAGVLGPPLSILRLCRTRRGLCSGASGRSRERRRHEGDAGGLGGRKTGRAGDRL